MATTKESPEADVTVRPVTPDDWPTFASFFEATGSPKYCWCMAWRKTSEETKALAAETEADRAAGRKSPGRAFLRHAMETRITGGTRVGLLAYAGEEPVAWCSVAPRPTFSRLGGPKDFADEPDAVWSISCFFISRPWRGKGLSRRLIAEAAAYARAGGAKVLEAYPVDPDSPSYRFMGLVPVFASVGFTAVSTAGSRRTVMRLAL